MLKGLTIGEFAKVVGRSENHVGEIERGRENGGLPFLREAARVLECTIDDITNGVIPRQRRMPKTKAGAA